MSVQTAEIEHFVVVLRLQVIEHHVEPGPEESLDRIFQEAGKLLHRQGLGPGFERQRCRCRCGRDRVRLPPLARIGEQLRISLEIAAAERLQRVHRGALREQVALLALPARGQVVAQLRHQHRGRLLGVVARAAPRPTHIEHAPGREQRFEHEVAIVLAAGTVARTILAWLMQQVEIAARALAWIVAFVHAQKADDLERNRPQRHQGAEGHAAGQETAAASGVVQAAEPALAQHLQRHRFVESGSKAMIDPGGQRVIEAGADLALAQVLRLAEGFEQIAAALRPLQRRGTVAGHAPPVLQHVEQIGQRPHQRGVQPADLIEGHDTGKPVLARPGVAQQHAAQAEAPGVLLAAGAQTEIGALLRVQPPAHARAGHPLREAGPVLRLQAETPGDGRHVEQGGDIGGQNALLRQAQQPVHGDQEGIGRARRQVGDVEGNEARVAGRVLAEHRADGGREGRDVGSHHHDVARLQRLVVPLRQKMQQLIVQDLDFALGAVRDVKDHRTIRRGDDLARMLGQG